MKTKTRLSSSRASIRRKNRAEIAGQTFLYILGIVIVAAILIYGIRAMFSLSDKTEEVKMVQFKEDLKKTLLNGMKINTVVNKNIKVPMQATEICFIERDKPISNCPSGLNGMVCDSWKEGVKHNVFIIDKNPFEFIDVANYKGDPIIRTENNNFICLPVRSGSFNLNTVGQGKDILIKGQ